MKKKKFLLLIVLLVFAIPFSALCDTKISNINLKIDIEEDDFSDLPELDITSKSKNYSVDDYEITIGLDGKEMDPDLSDKEMDDQDETGGPGASSAKTTKKVSTTNKKKAEPVTCEITLSASDDYYFNTMSKKNIKVSGLEANCTKASRKDSGKTLVLTVQLPGIKTKVRMVETAYWNEEGFAVWEKADNAEVYEVRLYRDGKSTGKTYETTSTKFNFYPLMTKPGSYYYTVRAKDYDGESSKRTESDTITINEAQAARFKEKYAIEYEIVDVESGPSANRNILNGGWQQENGRYWYRMDDGMMPQGNWMQIGEDWYWFDEDGYMIQDEWKSWKGKEYYFGNDGKMLINSKTPDGFQVGSDGAKK